MEIAIELSHEVLDEIAERAAELAVARLANQSPYLSVAEAAEYARCNRQRIYDLRSAGVLTRYADGSRALVSREELDAHIRAAPSNGVPGATH